MLRYFLTAFAVACIAIIAIAGFQGKVSKETPAYGTKMFNNMDYQSKYRALGESEFAGFANGAAARPPVPGTVARGTGLNEATVFSAAYNAAAQENPEFATGKDKSGKFIDGFPKRSLKTQADGSLAPYVLTNETLALGKQKFEIYCAVCHGLAADGKGILRQRGSIETETPGGPIVLNAIANLQDAPFRKYPNGQIYDTIRHGAKTMGAYGDKLNPEERWAVVAYLRALQLSQNCPDALVPAGVDKTNLK